MLGKMEEDIPNKASKAYPYQEYAFQSPTYYMSLFPLAVKVAYRVENILRDFYRVEWGMSLNFIQSTVVLFVPLSNLVVWGLGGNHYGCGGKQWSQIPCKEELQKICM